MRNQIILFSVFLITFNILKLTSQIRKLDSLEKLIVNYSNNGIEEELSLESLLKEIKSLMDRQYKSELGRLLSKVEPIVDSAFI